MKRHVTLAAFVVVVTAAAASCGDNPASPTSNVAQRTAPADASAQRVPDNGNAYGDDNDNGISKHAAQRAALLTAVPVTGVLSDGGSFVGSFTATHISIDPASRALSMAGTLVGTATKVDGTISQVTQQFTAPMTLARTAGTAGVFRTASMATCDILFLDLAPLHLDLLGLTVDLNEVVLDLSAVSGAGKLLGNLLCAVVGLLDGFGLLGAITQLLNTINNILAGLSPGGATGAALIVPSLFVAPTAYVIRS